MMREEYLYLYDVSVLCVFEQEEIDQVDSKNEHYTTPGKWVLIDVEHKGESIYDLMDEALLSNIQKDFNAKFE